ncbi:histidine phosphatase family protein [Chitinilyticum litopenaei]|uniref:histidine phosphatase family protein n=1 Tax=Chitinilyticum litopenaei TaxID=1121276 RepID=UPI0009DC2940|nr:histidine phosphatase family protein [Chitinilyticum litopenaei]
MSHTIYLLRHGQTDYNRERRLQGHCDSPLTALGESQARAMGATLRAEIGDPAHWRVLASPLGRARQTAALVCAELGLPAGSVQSDERLIEVAFGAWEMLEVEALHSRHPQLAHQPDWHFQAPGCEPYPAVLARIKAWLADTSLPPKLIVVAHGLLGRILRGVYADLDHPAIWQQDMPQDAFFRLQGGTITRIACLPAADYAASASCSQIPSFCSRASVSGV